MTPRTEEIPGDGMTAPSIAVIGLQWGDEGKGKLVDHLAGEVAAVVRFHGGNNAGHTIVVGEDVFKLHLLPSGIVREGVRALIGSGVVVDPWALLDEIGLLRADGVVVTPERLMIADTASLILPLHRMLDRGSEQALGTAKIGTTGRGIGPCYEDKVGRRGIRVCDLADGDWLAARVAGLVAHHRPRLPELDAGRLTRDLLDLAPQILPYAGPVWRELDALRRDGKGVLYEGAQAMALDIDHGTYPYVTSSNCGAGAAAVSCGGSAPARVIGVLKAYATRVGEGPFPTELAGAAGARLAARGAEVGTTTGRPRRCGWLDLVAVAQAARLAGASELAVTKLDVLDGMEKIDLCVGYSLDGRDLDRVPPLAPEIARLEPQYQQFDGWSTPTASLRAPRELPQPARTYLQAIADRVGLPIRTVSTGPGRDDVLACHLVPARSVGIV